MESTPTLQQMDSLTAQLRECGVQSLHGAAKRKRLLALVLVLAMMTREFGHVSIQYHEG
jgi:hypothetical protein